MESLTNHERDVLRAAMDRIIPEDDFPNASQNGVMDYFDRQFAGDLAGAVPFYRFGLASLDEEALATFHLPFIDLAPSRQDQIFEKIEAGDVIAHWPIEPKRFLERLTEHVAEGYYADPEYNRGNPGHASWQMIGFLNRTGLPKSEGRDDG